jgi:YHS domain-containing protein
MRRLANQFWPVLALPLAAVAVWGCNTKSAPDRAVDAQPAAASTDDDEAAQTLAKMDPIDREAAKMQGVCPVSDHALGSMGLPIKVEHNGVEVFLCCAACREAFDKDPATFIAKAKKSTK